MKDGGLWRHYTNEERNSFYGQSWLGGSSVPNPVPSSIELVMNDTPSIVKSFKTLSYEGNSAERNKHDIFFSTWIVDSIMTDMQEGSIPEFKEKEGKYFNYISGKQAFIKNGERVLDQNNVPMVDVSSLNFQGLGRVTHTTTSIDNG